MSDEVEDLVGWLLDWPYQGETMAEEAAVLIKQLTAERDRLRRAMEKLACKCSSNCDWEHEDVCPSWIARAALKGESHD